MSEWGFCCYVRQQIIEQFSKEFYSKYGQDIINTMINKCSINFEIVRYPTNEEILKECKIFKG